MCAALVNPLFTEKELAHAFDTCSASHILVHTSVLPLVLTTLQNAGRTRDEIRRTVVIISPSSEVPPELTSAGFVNVDKLDYTPVKTVPERFDGNASQATAFIYFSSGMYITSSVRRVFI